VRALAAVSGIDTAPFRLVFGGGTALSRAHRSIRRMSEDIDLKITAEGSFTRQALRQLRDAISRALLDAGFAFDPANPSHRESANASRYTLYRLPYDPIAQGQGSLRPEIQIETAVWPLRRPAITWPVTSFLAEAFERPPEAPGILCAGGADLAKGGSVTVTIDLPPQLEQAYREMAAVQGVSLNALVRDAVISSVSVPAFRGMAPEDPDPWIAEFKAWTLSHAADDLPVLSDEDISPESIYRDRGL
jgi:hypothetical protein